MRTAKFKIKELHAPPPHISFSAVYYSYYHNKHPTMHSDVPC